VRQQGRPGITATARALIDYWSNPEREKKLFFAQLEAVETAIYLHETAGGHGSSWIET